LASPYDYFACTLMAELTFTLRLQAHFEDNPNDLEYLKHDEPLHPTRVQPHMKHVPKYLMPNVAAVATTPVAGSGKPDGITFVPFSKGRGRGRGRGRGGNISGSGGGRGGKNKKHDPLKKFR
jgi:ATP-dependent RNA helicase DDX56/DBP9